MPGGAAAFMSYVRFNDQHDDGQLSQFRERLAAEVRAQTGQEFAIFQDRNDIAWGQNWQQRIDEALDAVTLLLVIITPSFFLSPPCRAEFQRFQQRERTLGRSDLILPMYYISAPELDDPALRESDEIAKVLASRQFADWRELRFEPFTSPLVRKAIAQLASQMRDAFSRPSAVPAHSAQHAETADSPTESVDQADVTDGVTTKIEPTTHVVDGFPGRGDFTTVSEAIKAARPGDRILVRPGLYKEGLIVKKPLEILGDGPVSDIEVRARRANAVLFDAKIGRIANLTLRQTGGKGEWFAVNIARGQLDVEGCDISSQSLAGVAIHDRADPRLRRNKIHDGAESGVFVYERGLGTLEDNEITGNARNGVAIITGGSPTLRRNQIHDNKANGVTIYDDGLGTLEDNDITGNARNGVAIITGGSPTLRRNQIQDNKGNGIHVYDHGLGTLEDNDITGNAYAGVGISIGGDPTVRGNRIHDGKRNGIHIHDNGLGTLEDNDITGNATAGVAIMTGGNPTLRRNQIHDNKESGVFVYERGLGTLEDNDITSNTYAGVFVQTGGNPTVRANRINRNGQRGVLVHKGGRGTVEDNDLTGNGQGAWYITEDCKANVTRARNKE